MTATRSVTTPAAALPPSLRPPERRGPWAQTVSGGRWWYIDPQPEDVRWRDIAMALARVPRFGGHVSEDVPHYSVAQHCCIVCDWLPPTLRLAGLLHDAHEAYLGDLLTPLKAALAEAGGDQVVETWRQLVEVTDQAIHAAAGIALPSGGDALVIRHHDLRALATERRDLLAECEAPWTVQLPPPDRITIQPWGPLMAADQWLARLRRWLSADAPVHG